LSDFNFEWDPAKNELNKKKHGIDFEDAETAFYDDCALYLYDEEHSNETEERFKLIGADYNARTLVVCHCYRNGDSIIRIFSARRATKSEVSWYRGDK